MKNIEKNNGVESMRANANRAVSCVHHHVNAKRSRLHLREMEFLQDQGSRETDTIDRMGEVARGMRGRRLSFEDWAGNGWGLPNSACGKQKQKNPAHRGASRFVV